MKESKTFHKILGFVLIFGGIILYPTPIPGTTLLIILGLIWIIGEQKTLHFLKKILSKKILKKLKIKSFMKKCK